MRFAKIAKKLFYFLLLVGFFAILDHSEAAVPMGSILGDMAKKTKGPGSVSLESLKAQLEAWHRAISNGAVHKSRT